MRRADALAPELVEDRGRIAVEARFVRWTRGAGETIPAVLGEDDAEAPHMEAHGEGHAPSHRLAVAMEDDDRASAGVDGWELGRDDEGAVVGVQGEEGDAGRRDEWRLVRGGVEEEPVAEARHEAEGEVRQGSPGECSEEGATRPAPRSQPCAAFTSSATLGSCPSTA